MGFLETGCFPQAEDGLGIHSLIDFVYGFQGKLAWKVFSGSTLWARVLQQKYCMSNSNGNVRNPPSASRLWRKLAPHFQNFQNMHFRKAGREEISSRRSNWLGVILNPLKHALSPPLLNWARSVVIKDIMLDEMIFTLTVTEKYIKTYIETIRASRPRVPICCF